MKQGSSLGSLIDWVERGSSKGLYLYMPGGGLTEPLRPDWMRRHICFDAGAGSDYEDIQYVHDICRLPYKNCFVEFRFNSIESPEPIYLCALLEEHAEELNEANFVLALVFARSKKDDWIFVGKMDIAAPFGKLSHRLEDASKRFSSTFDNAFRVVTRFFCLLNCAGVNRVEHKPDAALQRARIKRGKQPLFSYWTLDVDLAERHEKTEHQGGTHASPRLHLRRGHMRKVDNQRFAWVRPHVVGNKKLGMVHKDYAIKTGRSA